MPTNLSKRVFKTIEQLGFEHIWTNGKGFRCYAHPDDPEQTEMTVSPSLQREQAARQVIRDCQKIAGQLPEIAKRKGSNVKDRRAHEREQAERRLAWAEAKKARLLAGQADREHVRKIEELIELRREELRKLHIEMTSVPQGNQHSGRGRRDHHSGTEDRTPL